MVLFTTAWSPPDSQGPAPSPSYLSALFLPPPAMPLYGGQFQGAKLMPPSSSTPHSRYLGSWNSPSKDSSHGQPARSSALGISFGRPSSELRGGHRVAIWGQEGGGFGQSWALQAGVSHICMGEVPCSEGWSWKWEESESWPTFVLLPPSPANDWGEPTESVLLGITWCWPGDVSLH